MDAAVNRETNAMAMRLRSIGEIARLIISSDDLESLLVHVNRGISKHTQWALSSIIAVDFKAGCSRLVSSSNPYNPSDDPTFQDRTWRISESPGAQAARSGQFVVIEDAQAQDRFPKYKIQAKDQGFHTLVLVPVGTTDEAGRPLVLSLKSRSVISVDNVERSFIQTIADLAALAVQKVRRIRSEATISNRLEKSVSDYSRLMRSALGKESRDALVEQIDSVLPCPWLVVDFLALSHVYSATAPSVIPKECWPLFLVKGAETLVVDQLQHLTNEEPSLNDEPIRLTLCDDLKPINTRIELLKVDDSAIGALCLFPESPRLDPLDLVIAQAAHFAMSVQLMRNFVQFRSVAHSQSDVLHRLFEGIWQSEDDITAHALHNGIDVTQPQRMFLIGYNCANAPENATLATHVVMRSLSNAFGDGVVAAYADQIVVMLSGAGASRLDDSAAVGRFWRDIRWAFGDDAVIAHCQECRSVSDYRVAYSQGARVVQLARSLKIRGWVDRERLGSATVLLSLADHHLVNAFLEDGIRRVVSYDERHNTDYYRTIKAFVECEGRFQASANFLELHPTTLRYRLGRLEELFGIDATVPASRFDLQLAIKLMELKDIPRMGS